MCHDYTTYYVLTLQTFDGPAGSTRLPAPRQSLRLCWRDHDGADYSLPRRAWPEHTRRDLLHLECCEAEDIVNCPDLDQSHLLPPRPLEPAVEFCCAHRCFPRSDVRSLTECLYVRKPVRARRQLERQVFGKNAFTTVG